MYEFVGKSSPFLVLAFLALLDGGEKPNGSILPKKITWEKTEMRTFRGESSMKEEAHSYNTGDIISTGYSAIAKSYVFYHQMIDIQYSKN